MSLQTRCVGFVSRLLQQMLHRFTSTLSVFVFAGVRLSGQDSERGTFNQRHAVSFDQSTGRRCDPFEIDALHLICNAALATELDAQPCCHTPPLTGQGWTTASWNVGFHTAAATAGTAR